MKPSDLLLFTATLALIACSKSDAAKDAAVVLPASTQDSAATAAAVAPVVVPVAAPSAPAETSADGRTVYTENCKKCHGATGAPSPVMKKKFDKLAAFDAAFFANRSDDSIVTILTKGKSEGMKSFKDKMSADEMKAVAAYIRTFAK